MEKHIYDDRDICRKCGLSRGYIEHFQVVCVPYRHRPGPKPKITPRPKEKQPWWRYALPVLSMVLLVYMAFHVCSYSKGAITIYAGMSVHLVKTLFPAALFMALLGGLIYHYSTTIGSYLFLACVGGLGYIGIRWVMGWSIPEDMAWVAWIMGLIAGSMVLGITGYALIQRWLIRHGIFWN